MIVIYIPKVSSYAAHSGGRCSDLTCEEVQHVYLWHSNTTYLSQGHSHIDYLSTTVCGVCMYISMDEYIYCYIYIIDIYMLKNNQIKCNGVEHPQPLNSFHSFSAFYLQASFGYYKTMKRRRKGEYNTSCSVCTCAIVIHVWITFSFYPITVPFLSSSSYQISNDMVISKTALVS